MTYMGQYHYGTMQILEALAGELELIGELTSRATEVIRNGGTVWTSMYMGHMPHFEHADERRGNPGIIKSHNDFSVLEPEDLVFTNFCHREVLEAHERGVYVVCVTTPYHDNEFRPAGFTHVSHGNPDGLFYRDVSDAILHSHMPYQQGLVECQEIPEFTLCPCATTGGGAIHWMLNAEVAAKVGTTNLDSYDKASHYLSVLTERIDRTAEHMPEIQETAATMAERVLSGGRWFAESLEHPGFKEEFQVACGPRMVNTGDWNACRDRNIMSISAISPAFPDEVRLATRKKAEGAFVIGISPTSLDGVVTDAGLHNIADVGFDNFSPESGGVVDIAGRSETICPTSGVAGNVIQQMINAQWAQEMIVRGAVPTFLRAVYQTGGREYNAAMEDEFARRGY